ncbi:hypothetical protein K438DRAFT_1960154 [Mycena galopus ATCC 62051]|nr:hypothetical protein K438DRAFT_1960154 [Mycena galopus ATCC 62051]
MSRVAFAFFAFIARPPCLVSPSCLLSGRRRLARRVPANERPSFVSFAVATKWSGERSGAHLDRVFASRFRFAISSSSIVHLSRVVSPSCLWCGGDFFGFWSADEDYRAIDLCLAWRPVWVRHHESIFTETQSNSCRLSPCLIFSPLRSTALRVSSLPCRGFLNFPPPLLVSSSPPPPSPLLTLLSPSQPPYQIPRKDMTPLLRPRPLLTTARAPLDAAGFLLVPQPRQHGAQNGSYHNGSAPPRSKLPGVDSLNGSLRRGRRG